MWSVIGDSFTVIYVYNKIIILETTNMVPTTVIAQVVTLLSWAEGLCCFTLLYLSSIRIPISWEATCSVFFFVFSLVFQ